jgi:hypothetical protein
MEAFGAPAFGSTALFEERERMTKVLGDLCGLGTGESAARCGRAWCGYFDGTRGTCALLTHDVPARLGPQALRWFAAHRPVRDIASIEQIDETLKARTCSL